MPRLALAALASLFLAAPVSAQSLSVLLPQISFPDPVSNPSTKGCAASATDPCLMAE